LRELPFETILSSLKKEEFTEKLLTLFKKFTSGLSNRKMKKREERRKGKKKLEVKFRFLIIYLFIV
jgi:hypothetical protein